MIEYTCLNCHKTAKTIHKHQKYCSATACQRARKRINAKKRKNSKKQNDKVKLFADDYGSQNSNLPINDLKKEIAQLKASQIKLEKQVADLQKVASPKKMNETINSLIKIVHAQQNEIKKFYSLYSFDRETGEI